MNKEDPDLRKDAAFQRRQAAVALGRAEVARQNAQEWEDRAAACLAQAERLERGG